MRIPTYHDRDDVRQDHSMTSMIDVVFLLLIFFVCASIGQMRELLLGTELSAGAIDAEQYERQEKPLGDVWVYVGLDENAKTTVQLGKEGTIFRQGESLEFKNAPDYGKLVKQLGELAKVAPEIPVILDIEPGVAMGNVLNVYHACKRAGFQRVDFALNPDTAAPSIRKGT